MERAADRQRSNQAKIGSRVGRKTIRILLQDHTLEHFSSSRAVLRGVQGGFHPDDEDLSPGARFS